jgi:hypothetical protein
LFSRKDFFLSLGEALPCRSLGGLTFLGRPVFLPALRSLVGELRFGLPVARASLRIRGFLLFFSVWLRRGQPVVVLGAGIVALVSRHPCPFVPPALPLSCR